jgi:hypothetical protein
MFLLFLYQTICSVGRGSIRAHSLCRSRARSRGSHDGLSAAIILVIVVIFNRITAVVIVFVVIQTVETQELVPSAADWRWQMERR